MRVKPTLLLVDGDILIYKTLTAVEKEIRWDHGVWTLHVNEDEAHARILGLLDEIKENTAEAHSMVITLSSMSNFRKAIYPPYKENRKSKRKPLYYKGLIAWLNRNYPCMQCKSLEADDVLGILATMYEAMTGNLAIIATIDKDLKSVPCHYYHLDDKTIHTVDLETADYNHKLQTLMGDAVDNYKGCPSVGAKTAQKLLDTDGSWVNILDKFNKSGVPEPETLVQAQVARICRITDYNFKTKEVIPWMIPTT